MGEVVRLRAELQGLVDGGTGTGRLRGDFPHPHYLLIDKKEVDSKSWPSCCGIFARQNSDRRR
jgi:hypothetical protein